MSVKVRAWQLVGVKTALHLGIICLAALALPFAGDKKEKVVDPRAGFNPKPPVGLGPQAISNEMDNCDQGFTPESTEKIESHATQH